MIRLTSLAILAASFHAPAHAQVFSGPATVIDGDTIDMTGTMVRLLGIDAPEATQTCSRGAEVWNCGAEATSTLRSIIGNTTLNCTGHDVDEHGRILAICENSVFDIGQEMVRRGMALAHDNAPDGYAQASAISQSMTTGLWSGQFQTPADWRAANPQSPAPKPEIAQLAREQGRPKRMAPQAVQRFADSMGCAIKGNRNRRGEWIYHLPGQNYYDVTRPEELFCTESEARAAGYRRSKE